MTPVASAVPTAWMAAAVRAEQMARTAPVVWTARAALVAPVATAANRSGAGSTEGWATVSGGDPVGSPRVAS